MYDMSAETVFNILPPNWILVSSLHGWLTGCFFKRIVFVKQIKAIGFNMSQSTTTWSNRQFINHDVTKSVGCWNFDWSFRKYLILRRHSSDACMLTVSQVSKKIMLSKFTVHNYLSRVTVICKWLLYAKYNFSSLKNSNRIVFTNETTLVITLEYFPLLFKDTVVTLKKIKSLWQIFSITHFFCSQDF